jgi:hypothetical protein
MNSRAGTGGRQTKPPTISRGSKSRGNMGKDGKTLNVLSLDNSSFENGDEAPPVAYSHCHNTFVQWR